MRKDRTRGRGKRRKRKGQRRQTDRQKDGEEKLREEKGERCEGRRDGSRAREKGAGSELAATESARLGRHRSSRPPAAPLRVPDPGSAQAPLPATTGAPRAAGSAPAHPRRRLPGAQPGADPSGRRGSAAGLSGPGENKGARRRGRGKEAPPAEERGGSAARGRGEPSLRPSPASRARARGRGQCLAPNPSALPGCPAHTDAGPFPARPGPRLAAGHPSWGTSGAICPASPKLWRAGCPPSAERPATRLPVGQRGARREAESWNPLQRPVPAPPPVLGLVWPQPASWEPVQSTVAERLGCSRDGGWV